MLIARLTNATKDRANTRESKAGGTAGAACRFPSSCRPRWEATRDGSRGQRARGIWVGGRQRCVRDRGRKGEREKGTQKQEGETRRARERRREGEKGERPKNHLIR
eukprot:6722844-Alexandrium_andersonii.AAC.1